LAQSLKSILHTFTQKDRLEPPVFSTSADRKEGILEFYIGLNDFIAIMEEKGVMAQKKLDRHRKRVFNLIQDRLLKKFWTQEKLEKLEQSIFDLNTTNLSPHEVANTLLNGND
jgi:putative protein kinase ArgK-like GTPase of G3E family